jgi:hypothetical protein
MLDEFARRIFDKFAPSKAAISAFLLDEFARRANSSLKLGSLLDSVNAPLISSIIARSRPDLHLEWKRWLFSVSLRQGARSQALQLRL